MTNLGFEAFLSPLTQLGLHDFLLNWTQLGRKTKENAKVQHDFFLEIVKNRRSNLKSPEDEDFSFLDRMLTTSSDGEMATNTDACFIISCVLFAAHGTVKTAMTFLLYSLAKHPEVQEKIFQEAKEALGHDFRGEITEEDVNLLPYLEAVIKESLRLFSPAPIVSRKLSSEKKIGSFTFPKDTEVFLSLFAMMRSPKNFDDPLTFNPDRFLGVDKMPLAFCPLSIGARKCPAGRYAINAFKIVVTKMLARYRIKLADGQPEMILTFGMYIKPKDTIWAILEGR
jgi:cytochrome P450 family 4